MKKKNIVAILICFIASLLFLFMTVSFSNAQSKKLEDEKTKNDDLSSHMEAGKQEKAQNSVLIDKIDNDPNQIAKDAKGKAEKFIDVLKENDGKADRDKSEAYKSQLKDVVSDDLRNSNDLSSISVPKDYDIDISTQRGESVPVLVSSKDRYLVIGYDAYADEISIVKEYKKA